MSVLNENHEANKDYDITSESVTEQTYTGWPKSLDL